MNTCNNCGSEISGNYCANCGQPIMLDRINGRYILREIGNVLNFQKGILYTIIQLSLRPGKSVRKFITEDRNRLVKPIMFILISSLLYTLVVQLFHFEDGYMRYSSDKESAITYIFTWIQNNYGYSNILMGMLMALWLKLLFRRYDYNFFEILILLCFVMGMGMLLFAFFAMIEIIIKVEMMQWAGFLSLIYFSWAIGQFFNGAPKVNYLKAFLAYMLGMLSFFFVGFSIGYIIDLMK